MNRRLFLSTLGLAAAGMALDPERLLWVPGRKTIFLPAVQKGLTATLLDINGRQVAAAWLNGDIAEFGPFKDAHTISHYQIDGHPFGLLSGHIYIPKRVMAHETATLKINGPIFS
jgi:hypothetical protein